MTNLLRAGRVALILLCAAAFGAEARADVKIKSRQTVQGHTFDNAVYIKGKRQRTEQMGGQSVTIQQCDLRRDLQLMPAMKSYTVNPYDTGTEPVNAPAPAARPKTTTERTQGGLVTSTVTTRDTGERKQMFGYTARHLITTIETKSSPDACNPSDSKMETDGWYIDAAFQLECDTERFARYYNAQPAGGGCRDRHESKVVGTARRGFPVWEKTTMYDQGGGEKFSTVNEVVELSQATLDASLFEPPADYREVKDFSAASMMAAMGGMNSHGNDDDNPAQPSSPGQAQMSAAEVGAKRPGVVRIGLAGVQTGAVGDNLNAAQLAAAVRGALSTRLTSATVEVVPIDSYAEAEAEAKRKQCDYIVYANVSHKKGGGGGFGGMLGKVGAAATGLGGMGGASGGSATANVKAKDELTLDVRLQAPGAATPAASSQFKAKAKSAGEDIVTPAVEQAAQLILGSMK
ncbi:MAG: hypothetical protein JOZ02_01545 [Acidobacteria bacterium]|nr:hypothetical protein [Acidobacteriota bacterium]